ncbi:MAG: GxxExxY protein [Chloroflexota bacterium]
MTDLLHKSLTGSILRAYYDVYNGTGRTYPERFYDRAMVYDLNTMAIRCVQQPEWQIIYREKVVGKQILDILIAGEVVVEDKVAPSLTRLHKAQLISYLKVTGKQAGLLLNFGGPKPEFQRLYFTPREPKASEASVKRVAESRELAGLVEPEMVYEIVGGLFDVHAALGPGFMGRIYANACYHELKLRGLPIKPYKAIQVFYRGESLGELKFGHLRVSDTVMVFPTAATSVADFELDNFREWLQVQQASLGILANFHDTELKPLFLRPKSV